MKLKLETYKHEKPLFFFSYLLVKQDYDSLPKCFCLQLGPIPRRPQTMMATQQ